MSSSETRFAVLLFSDIVGSTDLKSQHGAMVYLTASELHNALFERLATEEKLTLIKNTGDGYLARTESVAAAVRFALRLQDGLRTMQWPSFPLATRVGIHAGEVADVTTLGQTDVLGPAADLAARVMSVALGGQILLSRFPFDEGRHFVREHPPLTGGETPRLAWLAHGPYLMKGRDEPMEIFEVGAEGLAPLVPPPDGEKVRRAIRPDEEETLGWRPAAEVEVPGKPGWLVTEKLGEGGFGEVWLVRQRKTGERRVFKFCFDAERLRSLKRELSIFRLIRESLGDRDDITRLHDVRLDEAPFYLESDYVPSGNLVQWSEGKGGIGKVPLDARLTMMIAICRAVSAAHSVGVIHKDLKPSNVLMREDAAGHASPVLADFGIGIVTDASQFEKLGITQAGFTMSLTPGSDSSHTGTRMYAPPESLVGKPPTVQTDVYALGVLLYQLAIGDLQRPLATGWEKGVADRILREDIAAATEGDTEDRLRDVGSLLDRLASQPERRKRMWRAHWMKKAALLLGTAAVVMIVMMLGRGTFQKGKINRLNTQIQQRLESGSLSEKDVAETDRLVAELAGVSPENADEQRRRVADQIATFARTAIHRANLADSDQHQIESWLALLQPRDAAQAAQLQRALSERARQWEPVYSLKPPFGKDLPEGAMLEGEEVRLSQRRVTLPVSLSGNTRLEAVFGGVRNLKDVLGFSMEYDGGRAYEFRLVPPVLASRRIVLDLESSDFADRMKGWSASPSEVGSVILDGGQPVLRVERRRGDPKYVFVQKVFDAAPHRGKEWDITFRARRTGINTTGIGSMNFSIFAVDRGGKQITLAARGVATNSDWTSQSLAFRVPAESAQFFVRAAVDDATGRLDIADLRAIEKDPSAPADTPGKMVLAQPQKEWLLRPNLAPRWMASCDDRNVSVMTENGQRFLRLENTDAEGTKKVGAQCRVDPGIVKEVSLTARIRIPAEVVVGAGSWNQPRVLVTFHDHTGKDLYGSQHGFRAKQDWIFVTVKKTVPIEAETVEVAIHLNNCKGTIDVSELTCELIPHATQTKDAAGSGLPGVLILRNQIVLRRQPLPLESLDGETLRLTAERVGSYLRFQIGNQRPVEVFDPLSIPARELRAKLNADTDTRVRSLAAYRQTLPAKPQPLELGDELFSAGKFSEALSVYEKQAATSADKDTLAQAQFKMGLCLEQQKQTGDAETRLTEASKSEAKPWAILAACQLFVSYLNQKRMDDADAIFQFLRSRRDFSEIAPTVSDQLGHAIAIGYINRYRSSLEVGGPADWQEGIEKMSQVLDAADILHVNQDMKLGLDWHINRFYEATGQVDQAIERARIRLEQIDKDGLVSVGSYILWPALFSESYRRLCTIRGQPEKAWPILQRFDQADPDVAFAFEAIRCLVAMKKLDEAEAKARVFVAARLAKAKPSKVDAEFIHANLILGSILDLRQQPEQAKTVWADAMRKIREAFPDGRPADHYTITGRSELIHFLLLLTLSGELKDEDVPGIRNQIGKLYGSILATGNGPAMKTLMESTLTLVDRQMLNEMWSGERGTGFAGKFIRGEVVYPDIYSVPILLAVEELFIKGSVGRAGLTADAEAVYFHLSEDLVATLRAKEIGIPQMIGLLAAWKGVTGQFGWAGMQAQLPPKLRAPMAFVMGQRYVKLGKPEDAIGMFRTAKADAAQIKDGAKLAALADIEIKNLGGK